MTTVESSTAAAFARLSLAGARSPAPEVSTNDQHLVADRGVHHPRRRHGGRTGPQAEATERINWWLTALVAVLALTVLVPLYFAIVTSLKTPDELGGAGFGLPADPRWRTTPMRGS